GADVRTEADLDAVTDVDVIRSEGSDKNGGGASSVVVPAHTQTHFESSVPGMLKETPVAYTVAASDAKGASFARAFVEDSNFESAFVEGSKVETEESWKVEDGESWESRVLALACETGWAEIGDVPLLRERGWEAVYPLRREEQVVGLLLIDAAPEALTYEVRASLELLAAQVVIAIEDSRLVEENVRLERRISQSERLAALGRMAATVAHEVKNPLSAIKSIAQVMREDEYLKREYARDLELIVGETDRLSRSVTQMLSFASSAPRADEPRRVGELLDSILLLFRKEAANRKVTFKAEVEPSSEELDGVSAASLRDALTNLLLNALQATPAGGRVSLSTSVEGGRLSVAVTDSGPGVSPEHRERIWEPFFTTRQRGTGLGLAIVRKRIEEVGGEARLAQSKSGEGARFELIVPLQEGKDGEMGRRGDGVMR
ncbi:MAG: two-component system, NtrC family, sensor histidine kinase HydH, partial [Acidobacteriota bacterium]|nr:two-component system, NtrC family, sensor histidine kinase HydH [Acidobacteriota bacterium]